MSVLSFFGWVISHPLNRRSAHTKMQALGRFFRWQLASRVISERIALPFVDETFLLVGRGMTGATGNWYCGLHEPDEMGFLLHALRADELFVDIGANVGSYTLLAAGAVGANVISVEPIPETFQHLQTNVFLNHLESRVTGLNIGISEREGELRFSKSLDTMNRILLPDEKLDAISVPVKTLDEILKDKTPHVIKIDVEGHEFPILRGAEKTLAHPEIRAVIMETNQSGDKYGVSDTQLSHEMSKYGFSPFSYDALRREIQPVTTQSKNTVFLRNPDSVAALCKAAKIFRLCNGEI